LAEAQNDLVSKQNDLTALEAELASAEGDSRPPATNSIEELTNALSKIIKEMESNGHVPQSIMKETCDHMTSLLAGVNAISAEVRKKKSLAEAPDSASINEATSAKHHRGAEEIETPAPKQMRVGGSTHATTVVDGGPTPVDASAPAAQSASGKGSALGGARVA
jgi:hypothetical protein